MRSETTYLDVTRRVHRDLGTIPTAQEGESYFAEQLSR